MKVQPPIDFRRAAMIATGVTIVAFVGTLGGVFYTAFKQKREREAVQAQPFIDGNPLAYLDIVDGERLVGRIIVQLRRDVVPRAADNFSTLCSAPLGYGYKNSPLYGIERGCRIFGGDFYGSGSGGQAASGSPIPDESLELKHVGPGTLAMRSYGPDSINSQFYLTLRSTPLFDGVHEVVGYVMNDAGFETLAYLDKCAGANNRFRKKHDFRVGACGILPPGTAVKLRDADENLGELEAIGLAGLKLGNKQT